MKGTAVAKSDNSGHLPGQNVLSRVCRTIHSFLGRADAQERLLSIEERIEIGPKKTLMLINCAGRRFLFATASDSITPIVEVSPISETGTAASVSVIGYLGDRP